MEDRVFYRCSICGNLAGMIEDSGRVPVCCGRPMERLEPGSSDGAGEKHVPVITCEDGKVLVTIGELPHPMSEAHAIRWIWLETDRGGHMCRLQPGDRPAAGFRLCRNERALRAYAWCNLHGLWQADVQEEC